MRITMSIDNVPPLKKSAAFPILPRCRLFRALLVGGIVFGVMIAHLFDLPGYTFAGAAIIMESDGTVKSLGVPKGAAGMPDADSGNARSTLEERTAASYPELPWGIVPEIHLFGPAAPYAGDRRPQARGNTGQSPLSRVPRVGNP